MPEVLNRGRLHHNSLSKVKSIDISLLCQAWLRDSPTRMTQQMALEGAIRWDTRSKQASLPGHQREGWGPCLGCATVTKPGQTRNSDLIRPSNSQFKTLLLTNCTQTRHNAFRHFHLGLVKAHYSYHTPAWVSWLDRA